MRQVAAILVIAAPLFFSSTVSAAEPSPSELRAQLQKTLIGTEIEVRLESGESLTGVLTEVGENSFGLRMPLDEVRRRELNVQDAWSTKKIAFDQVHWLRENPHSVRTHPLVSAIRVGGEARLTTTSGATFAGKIEDFDGSQLTVGGRRFRLDEGSIATIELEQRDSLWSGAIIGGGIGAGFSLLVLAGCGTGCPTNELALLPLVGIGLGAGIGFDALVKEKKVFHLGEGAAKRLTLAPLITRDLKGVALSFSF